MVHVMALLPTCSNQGTTGSSATFHCYSIKSKSFIQVASSSALYLGVLGLNLGLKISYPQHQQANAGKEHQIKP